MKMAKLYLDLCVYNRPFDDQKQTRIALETNAFVYLSLLKFVAEEVK